MIEFLKYVFLALIQGFTEPIPISSSGHLVIFKHLINSSVLNDLNLEIILNFGSLIAIIIFFWKDIQKLIIDFFLYLKTKEKKYFNNFKYCILVIIGTIPAGLLGLLLKDSIEGLSSNVKIIGFALLITSLCLFLIKDIKGKKEDEEITYKDAFIIGLFQAVALFPGISRSGATIVGGMFRNLKRETAFKFSFILYIPISFATMILGVKDLVEANISSTLAFTYFICMIISGIVTYFATKWFNGIMKKGKLIYFVLYCLIVGTLVILFL